MSPYIYVPIYLSIGTGLMLYILGLDVRLNWSWSNILYTFRGNKRDLALYLSLPVSWFWLLIHLAIGLAFV